MMSNRSVTLVLSSKPDYNQAQAKFIVNVLIACETSGISLDLKTDGKLIYIRDL